MNVLRDLMMSVSLAGRRQIFLNQLSLSGISLSVNVVSLLPTPPIVTIDVAIRAALMAQYPRLICVSSIGSLSPF